MENIAPSLVLVWYIQRSIARGCSVKSGIQSFISNSNDEIYNQIVEKHILSSVETKLESQKMPSHQRYLFQLLKLGLSGQPIAAPLKSLENELILICERKIQRHSQQLPLMALIPTLFFIFPSIAILIVYPLLQLLQF